MQTIYAYRVFRHGTYFDVLICISLSLIFIAEISAHDVAEALGAPLADPAGRLGGGKWPKMFEMAPFFPCTAIGVMLNLGFLGGANWALGEWPWKPPWTRQGGARRGSFSSRVQGWRSLNFWGSKLVRPKMMIELSISRFFTDLTPFKPIYKTYYWQTT